MKFGFIKSCLIGFGCITPLLFTNVSAGVLYGDPDGGWTYLYTGEKVAPDDFEALDGTWNHENGSDAWDGSGIGVNDTAPGGVSSITENGDTFARFQDTGDPRNDGFVDPSNRKIYVTHDITEQVPDTEVLNSGVTLTFRTRLATAGLLDGDVPAGGDGYFLRDDGKSSFSIHQEAGGTISFALATTDDLAENATGALLMNNFDESGSMANVDTEESGEHREFPVSDPTKWNEFWVTIKGTDELAQYDVNVYANGSTTPLSLVVTSGAGSDATGSYLALGVHSTVQSGAFDVDYYGFKPGILTPKAGGLLGDFDGDGSLDVDDIDQLSLAVRSGSNDKKFDVNSDGNVNGDDRLVWVNSLKKTYLGDSNLDGEFNSGDFVVVFQAGQYEDATVGNSTWGTGDWSGDGDFDSGDFVGAFQAGGYEKGPRPSVSSVPEPSSLALLLIGMMVMLRFRSGR